MVEEVVEMIENGPTSRVHWCLFEGIGLHDFAVGKSKICREEKQTENPVDLDRAMAARLGLGLMLLALPLPTQIYSDQTSAVTPASNSSQHTSAAPNLANATTKASDGALRSTASLLVILVSLLHLYC
ncbi:signal transducer CD24-like [Kogia breviceps]|uniref:signal transducer CD24-like n=1 Tax=Kogia breviceps TaxID=27615 RepID=UPI0034D2D34B